LREGSFEEITAKQYCYAFARAAAAETLVIVVNSGEEATHLALESQIVTRECNLTPVLGRSPSTSLEDGVWNLSVPAKSGLVLSVE
jgi:hypothetical protein